MKLHKNIIKKFKNCNSGEAYIILKSLYFYSCKQSFIKIHDLKKLTNISDKILYNNLNSIKNKFEFGKPEEGNLPIDIENINKNYKQFLNLGKKEKFIKKNKAPRTTTKLINEKVLNPYLRELRKRGKSKIITGQYKGISRNVIRKIRNKYKELSYKDILNILLIALDYKYLKKINQSTNINTVFFSGINLVEKYLNDKDRKFKIVNSENKIVNNKMFGYFIKKENRYEHVPPKNKKAPYYKIKKELENRMFRNEKNNKFNKYFNENDIKDKYKWMIGEKGKNNKFIKGVK